MCGVALGYISGWVSPARLLAIGAGNGIDSLGDLGVVIDSKVVIAALFIVGQAGVHIRQGATSLIFDLRDNSGENLNAALVATDYCVPSGLIAQSQDKGGNVTDLRMSDENEITLLPEVKESTRR